MSGVWLLLFHGRKDPKQDMDDWGEEGPLLGPLRYVHTTYLHCIKYEFLYAEDARHFGLEKEGFLEVVDDCIHYQDVYYGDWSVCSPLEPGAHSHA